jgi:hypothetical protein
MFLRALLAFLALPGIVAFAVPIWWLAATHAELDSRWGLLPLVIGSATLLWCVREFFSPARHPGRRTMAEADARRGLG